MNHAEHTRDQDERNERMLVMIRYAGLAGMGAGVASPWPLSSVCSC